MKRQTSRCEKQIGEKIRVHDLIPYLIIMLFALVPIAVSIIESRPADIAITGGVVVRALDSDTLSAVSTEDQTSFDDSKIQMICVPQTITAGEETEVVLRGIPDMVCELSLCSPENVLLDLNMLPKRCDAEGMVRWTLCLPKDMASGIYTLKIKCGEIAVESLLCVKDD